MSLLKILVEYREGIISGLVVTLKLCSLIWTAGIILGAALGVASARWPRWFGIPARVASFLLSGIPVLVLLFWLHYPFQALLRLVIPPFYTAAAALAIVNVLLVADLVRGVLRDFPAQYIVAAQVCGMPPLRIVLRIQLPIILRQILPGLLLIQVSMLQATLFASLISVDEIFRVAQRINAQVYRPVEVYTTLAFFFLVICLPLNGLAYWLRRSYTRDISER